MKSKIIFSLFLSLIGISAINVYKQQYNIKDQDITKMIKTFYTEYIMACVKNSNMDTMNAIREKYCTKAFFNKIIKEKETDFDLFLNAQDCDVEWLKTLNVMKSSENEDKYMVSYINNYDESLIKIDLTVIFEDKSFRISNVNR